MDTIREYALQSATDYLEYLEKNNLGVEEITILDYRINEYDTLSLMLDRNLVSTDYLQLFMYDFLIDLDSIEEKNFNELNRILKITFSDELLEQLINNILKNNTESINNEEVLSKDNILQYIARNKIDFLDKMKLFIDLKFLVKNIQDFCSQDSIIISLPTQKPLKLEIKMQDFISNEQREAIKGVFSNPISYIWGISGSGKTQIVLFNCLLNIIMQDKKALVLAPTNTALEQILTTLIKKCDKRGISRKKFVRLGMPSNEFLNNFPQVCIQTDENENNLSNNQNTIFQQVMLKDRIQDVLVVGLTLDSFVKRYNFLSNLNFSHIFIDECAFSSLIKIIAPLSLNIPITFLGDHKQLMPICLMDDKIIKESKHNVCLWSLNTLFLEELLHNKEMLHNKNNYDEIVFKDISYYKLTTTHRYGDNLAKVLDKHVYLSGLKGIGQETEIYYIDSTKFGETYKYNSINNRNESQGEAQAIMNLIRHDIKDYAILTPFKHQQQLLISKGISRNHVFTIHKSQGREFSTIIFSPVKFSKHLTDSTNKSALFALNVAVSRLKHTLIIVCDYNQWITKHNQFISSLLRLAKPYLTSNNHNNMSLPF